MSMAEHRWIIMPIEVQRRELDAKLVVAAHASQRGFKTLIGQDRIVRRLSSYLPKGILFDKSIGAKGDKKVYRYHAQGHAIAAMDEEATGFMIAPDQFMNARMAEDTLSMTKRWFCISEEVRQTCLRTYPQFEDRFVTTGLARTDTWREPLCRMFQAQADEIKQEYGRFVLFNSNFGLVNHALGDRFIERQIRKVEGNCDDEMTNFDRYFSEGAENLEKFKQVLPKILDWLPDHKLVVRPHPSENVASWEQFFSGEPRVIVKSKGTVTPWILASDFVIHHGCTTGVEAEIMGQAQANYAPVPDMHHDTPMAKTFSRFAYTEEELKQLVVEGVLHNKSPRMPIDKQETFFASLEGRYVSEKIVDEFEKIAIVSGEVPNWLPVLSYTPRHLVSAFKDVTQSAKAYAAQKYSGVTVEQLSEKLESICDLLGLPGGLQVSKVFKNLYRIESGDSSK